MSKKSRLAKEIDGVMEANAAVNKKAKDTSPVPTKKVKDTSPVVHQNSKIKFDLHIRERDDLTERQKVILETMLHKDTKCVFIDGFWGTGKSFLSILAATKLLNDRRVSDLLFIRNPVESSTSGKIGFLKGSVEEKMAPYIQILHDKLEEILPKNEIDLLAAENRIQGLPLGFTRGLSWNAKVIVVDEAASLSYEDILLLMSRCGKFTKLFFIGDSENQNDIGSKSGFKKMFDQFSDMESKENGVFTFELKEETDIVRSDFVRFILKKVGKIKF